MENKNRLKEWENVLRTMLFYKMETAYIDEIDGKIYCFDSDPFHNGVHAFFATIDDVKRIVENEKTKDV